MTRDLTQQQLLDAVKMTADSDTLLDYALLPNPNPLTVGATGTTLTLLVSNPSDVDVICKKITVTIPVGTNAQDLTASSDIGSEVPAGWNISGAFVLTPKPGEETITKHGLPFVFTKINVNEEPGTSAISISETAKTSSEVEKIRKTTIPLAKFPPQFSCSSLTVTPISVPSGGTAHLMWNGTPADYVIGYDAGTGYKEYTVGNNGPYDTQSLKRWPTVLFTLTVKAAVHGQILTMWRQALVEVAAAKPAITSFKGTMVGDRQVKFSFAASNADSCRLSGSPHPFNPTETTEALTIDRTRYTLVAHSAASGLDSDPVTVMVKWGVVSSAQTASKANELRSRLFVTPDGATLIAATDQTVNIYSQWGGNSVYLINTSDFAVRTLFTNERFSGVRPALSKDGKQLVLGINDAQGVQFLGIRSAPRFDQGPTVKVEQVGGRASWSVFSPDGSIVYTLGEWAQIQGRSPSDLRQSQTISVPFCGPLAISTDGATFYIAGYGQNTQPDRDAIAVVDTRTLKRDIMTLSRTAHSFLVDPQRKRIYVMEPTYGIEVFDLENFKLVGTKPLNGLAYRAALSPLGDAIFVARGLNSLAVIDVESLALIAEIPIGDGSVDLVFSPDGARLYVLTERGKVLALKMTEVS